jgi:alkanesulfonate monooxygenase SsuD/methylene tetrahydromethanopterin reductase-like flavin-dependent oxidoreductase (luciferase family)
LSGGRVTLGVGVGGEYTPEFQAVDIDPATRGERVNEALQVIRSLWADTTTNFDGRFYSLKDAHIEPRPLQRPNPPIIVGGRSAAARRRVAELGDGFLPYMVTPAMYSDAVNDIRTRAARVGRDPAQLENCLLVYINIGDSAASSLDVLRSDLEGKYAHSFEGIVDKYCIYGTPEECRARIDEFVAAGVQHFVFGAIPNRDRLPESIASLERHIISYYRGVAVS